jgi:hypothetical protein
MDDDAKEMAIDLWDKGWGNAADAWDFTPSVLATEAGIDEAVVECVLDVFGLPMAVRDPAEAVDDFLAGRLPFRTTPILRDPNGAAAVIHHGLLSSSIRERLESLLKKHTQPWETYAKHRGECLEDLAIDLLIPHLPGSTVLRGLEYYVKDPSHPSAQTTPLEYKAVTEGDGLILIDDVAIIVEAKSGSLSQAAKGGDGARLTKDLRKLVTSAAEQSDRLRQRIAEDWCLRLRDGTWIDLHHIREIHAIAVSLDDLSGIATVTSELVRAGLLRSEHLPWTVSLHDLRIVCELTARPPELLLYLRRRTEPDVTRRFHAVDELDFFLEYYSTGLYTEPDPDRVFQELPQLGEPSVASRRRFKSQQLQLLTSRTDQLDAWYFYQMGIRATPSPKPSMVVDENLIELVDCLSGTAEFGWLRVCATLLAGDTPTRRQFGRYGADVVRATKADGKTHSVTLAGGSRADDSFVLVWASYDETLPDPAPLLGSYVSAKKHQLQVAWGAGFLFSALDGQAKALPVAMVYDNRRPGEDESLDRLVTSFKLRPPEAMQRSLPPRGKR